MKNVNYFKLGLFVLAGFFVIIASVFYLGFKEQFESKLEFVTYFDQSVQGLDVGSSVKASGVTIGRVTDISLVKNSDGLVKVTMSAVNNILTSQEQLGMSADQINNAYKDYIKKSVDRGVRCSLTFQGITGLKYVELDIVDPSKVSTVSLEFEVKALYIPATRSTLENTMNSFDQAITRIASVDYKQLAGHLDQLIVALRDRIDGEDMKAILRETAGTMKEVRVGVVSVNNFTKEELPALSKDWQATTTRLRKLLDTMEGEVVKSDLSGTTKEFKVSANKLGELSDEVKLEVVKVSKNLNDNLGRIDSLIQEMTPEIKKTVAQAGQAGASVVTLRANLVESLEKLNRTLDSIRQLSDFLERNPSALIRGKE